MSSTGTLSAGRKRTVLLPHPIDEHVAFVALGEEFVAEFWAADVVCAHKSLAAYVSDVSGEFSREFVESLKKGRAGCVADVVAHFLFAVDFEVFLAARTMSTALPPHVELMRLDTAAFFSTSSTLGPATSPQTWGFLPNEKRSGFTGGVVLPPTSLPVIPIPH